MKRRLAALMMCLPWVAFGQVTQGPSITGTQQTVNDGPGDQTDPHVSGDWVSYTNQVNGGSEVRYHNLMQNSDAPVPSYGGMDFLSDVSGSTLVYTHLTTESSIYAYDLSGSGAPVELAPSPGSNRREARVGGHTVAWQDFDYTGDTRTPEIAAYDLTTGTVSRLTNDLLLDKDPAVSPDGNVVVWTKCQQDGTGCHIGEAVGSNGVWTTGVITSGAGEDALPDTNGQVVVYSSVRTENSVTDEDIYWQPVGGGAEQRLSLPGQQTNPNVSGNLIAFEQLDTSTSVPNYDIWLFDIATQTLYRLTDSPQDETLNDISVGADGTVRVVWTQAGADYNVYAFTFHLAPAPSVCNDQATSCADPGSRPLIAQLDLTRTQGQPVFQFENFAANPGDGLLCVDNGVNGSRATAGAVLVNGEKHLDASVFKHTMASVEQVVPLEANNELAAIIMGAPGSGYRVRVYGASAGCTSESDGSGGNSAWDDHHHFHGGFHSTRTVSGQHMLVLDNGSYIAPPQAQAATEGATMGCSSVGMSGVWAAMLILLGLLGSRRRPVPVPVKVPKKR
jgi:uncharacterized protein (TIGR03382 family)